MADAPTFTPRRELGRTRFVATALGIGDLADRAVPFDACVATARRALDAERPGYRNSAAVARCGRMLSVTSYDPDPNMDLFNDYLLAVEALAFGFRGVYALDTASGDWFDEGRGEPVDAPDTGRG